MLEESEEACMSGSCVTRALNEYQWLQLSKQQKCHVLWEEAGLLERQKSVTWNCEKTEDGMMG